MDRLEQRISDAELEVMQVLWDAEDALPVTTIRRALKERKGWEATTVKTLISRLLGKGAIRQEKRHVYHYSPCISREDYNAWAAGALVDKLFKGSARNLVAALVRSDGLSREDIEELRALFRMED